MSTETGRAGVADQVRQEPASAEGWYPDPDTTGQLRWWNGAAWTGAVRPLDGGQQAPPATGTRTFIRRGGIAVAALAAIGLALLSQM